MDLEILSKCPICYEIVKEPVEFPCRHEICLPCFNKSLETANHWCPICRKRISSWARRNVSNPVNAEKKRKIEEVLSKCDVSLLEPATTDTDTDDRRLSSPGEVRKDYLAELQKVQEERLLEESISEEEAKKLQAQEDEIAADRQREEQLGLATARSMEKEEHKRNIETQRQQIERDYRLARKLSLSSDDTPLIEEQIERDYTLARKPSEFSDDAPLMVQNIKKSPVEKKSTKKKRKNNQIPITHWFHSAKTQG